MTANQRVPLFITRFGLSDRTAIGVQTKHILSHFPHYRHRFWHQGLLDPTYPDSHCLEHPFNSRLRPFKTSRRLRGLSERVGLSRWRGDRPGAGLSQELRALAAATSAAYVAPIDVEDARRMRSILEILEVPFVLHLWDLLDNSIDDPSTRWLATTAREVFCLNSAIQREVETARPTTQLLAFQRQPSHVHAAWRSEFARGAVIGLIGDIGSYAAGVQALLSAVLESRRTGMNHRILYIGPRRALRRCNIDLPGVVSATGFMPTAEARDEALGRCSVAFLPGPTASPEADARSRFSIPSRVLDFVATALPLVGTVHPDSATFRWCADRGLAELLVAPEPSTLRRLVDELCDRSRWEAIQGKCASALPSLTSRSGVQALQQSLGVL